MRTSYLEAPQNAHLGHLLPPSPVKVSLRFAVAQVVDENDAGHVVVEDVARVAVRLRAAHVEQF